MNTGNDIVWAALTAARPGPDFDPCPGSPAAVAMRDAVLSRPVARARRFTQRRIALTAVPAAAMAVAAVIALVVVSPASHPTAGPGDAALRTAILDAWQQHAGDISDWTLTSQKPGHPMTVIRHGWSYPAFPAVGQTVRFRGLEYTGDGRLRDDSESFYRENAAMQQLNVPETSLPKFASIIRVDYLAHTWSKCVSDEYQFDTAGLGMSPAALRAEIAHGTLTPGRTVELDGRQALELGQKSGVPDEILTLYVDARTYVPLRATSVLTQLGSGRVNWIITLAYKLVTATPAALRVLTPPIPAAFTRGSELCSSRRF